MQFLGSQIIKTGDIFKYNCNKFLLQEPWSKGKILTCWSYYLKGRAFNPPITMNDSLVTDLPISIALCFLLIYGVYRTILENALDGLYGHQDPSTYIYLIWKDEGLSCPWYFNLRLQGFYVWCSDLKRCKILVILETEVKANAVDISMYFTGLWQWVFTFQNCWMSVDSLVY